MIPGSRDVKQEEPDTAEDYGADPYQSLVLRRMKKELANTHEEVQDLRALLQSTSEAHDAKLIDLQAQVNQSTREVYDLRLGLQAQLDTIVRMISGGPWMFNPLSQMFTQPPETQNFPRQYSLNQGVPMTSQMFGTDGFATSQQLQTFTQPPVPQNFSEEYIVNQGTLSPGTDTSQQSLSQVEFGFYDLPEKAPTSDRPTIAVKAGQKSVEMCLFCEGKYHESQGCTRLTSGAQRSEFVRKNKICERCLKPLRQNSLHEPCTTEKCAICNKNHNTILCRVLERRYCGFCQSRGHFDKKCPKYFIDVSVTDRRAMLEKEDRCLYCFKKNSVGNHEKCRTTNCCRTCKEKYNDPKKALHHSFLCLENKKLKTNNEGNRYAPYP